jgi:hypothetical protein
MQHTAISSQGFFRNRILIGGLILYGCSFAVLLRNKNFDPTGAVIVLALFGGLFPFLAWIATRRALPLSVSVRPSTSELIVLTGYIIALSLYLIGGPQWIDQHLPSFWIDSLRIKFFVSLAKKLVVFVAIPFAIFRFGFGYRIRDFGIDNWQTTVIGGIITGNQVSAIQTSGHAPTQPSESAIIATLQPGNYTAIVRGRNNTMGVALVEV